MKKIVLIILAMLSLIACENKEKKNDVETPIEAPTITQGIYGQVRERYGNWQPFRDPDGTWGFRPIVRDIYVYEYTTIKDFDQLYIGYIYPANKMPKPLVATTTSKEDGFYEIQLEPGKYSVFILDNGSMRANWDDENGGLQPVTIEEGSLLRFDLLLDNGCD